MTNDHHSTVQRAYHPQKHFIAAQLHNVWLLPPKQHFAATKICRRSLAPVTAMLSSGKRLSRLLPTLMRFLSPDRLSPFGKGGINSYCYCSGDPINYIDPTGRARKMRLYLTRKQQQRERARALQEQERFAAARDKVFRQPSNIDAIVSHLPGADGANFIGALPRELNRDISLPLLHRDINTIKTRQQDVDKLSPLGFELDFQVATRNLRVPEALHILYDACDEIRKGAIYNKDFITKWYHEMRNRYDPKKRSIIPRRHSL